MQKHLFKKGISVLLSLFLFINLCGCEEYWSNFLGDTSSKAVNVIAEGALTLRFLYVGQADSTFITLPDGKSLLVDGGDDADGSQIAQYISSLGFSSIDFVVATHPHADHIGGLDKILNQFDAGAIYAPQIPESAEPDTKNYKDFLEAAQAQSCGLTNLHAGTIIYSSDSTEIVCLSPSDRDVYSDLNNYSLVLQITYKNNHILLMGDAEQEVENALLQDYSDLHADLLKVGHHGSSSASSSSFIKAVSPAYAVISCGIDNSYGFPKDQTLQTLSNIGAQIFTTSENRTIIAVCNGQSIDISQHPEINLDGNTD